MKPTQFLNSQSFKRKFQIKELEIHTLRKFRNVAITTFLLLFFQNCFEYEETITFRKPFEGVVEISYTVPVFKKTNRSMISFLPIDFQSVQKKIKSNSQSSKLLLKDFVVEPVVLKEGEESLFKEKSKVSYKVEFEDVTDLEGVLIGTFVFRKRGRTLLAHREIPGLVSNGESSVGEQKVIKLTSRILRDGFINFKINYPITTETETNKGFISLGNIFWKFPLEDTLNQPEANNWDFKLRFF